MGNTVEAPRCFTLTILIFTHLHFDIHSIILLITWFNKFLCTTDIAEDYFILCPIRHAILFAVKDCLWVILVEEVMAALQ